jgi:hypothetical protein
MYSTAFCPGVRIDRQYATHDRTYVAGAQPDLIHDISQSTLNTI